jgi:hypothetical protein
MAKGALLHDAGALTVSVPMASRKRGGGRKLVIAPNGSDAWALPCVSVVRKLNRTEGT